MSVFENQSVVVSGASMGIGRALALMLAERGAGLVLCARGGEDLEASAWECRKRGAAVDVVKGDVSQSRTAERLARAARDMAGDVRKVWGFIHAAGVLHPGPGIVELNTREYENVMAASLGGAFQLSRAFMPLFREREGGHAVFFGSGAADRAQPGIGMYCVAKAAEEHFMRQLAEECPQCVSMAYRPGIVETRMQKQARNSSGGQAERLHSVFRPWKEQGLLWTPEHSAKILADLLESGRDLNGKVWDAREVESGR